MGRVGGRSIDISGLTIAELDGNYRSDSAMTNIIIGPSVTGAAPEDPSAL